MKSVLMLTTILAAMAGSAYAETAVEPAATTTAPAGQTVMEKKAFAASEEKLTAAEGKIKTACGIDVNAEIDWSVLDGYDYKALGRDKMNLVGTVTSNAEAQLGTLAQLCADADYKDAVKSVTMVKIVPAKDAAASASANTVAVSGSTVTVTMAPTSVDNTALDKYKKAF